MRFNFFRKIKALLIFFSVYAAVGMCAPPLVGYFLGCEFSGASYDWRLVFLPLIGLVSYMVGVAIDNIMDREVDARDPIKSRFYPTVTGEIELKKLKLATVVAALFLFVLLVVFFHIYWNFYAFLAYLIAVITGYTYCFASREFKNRFFVLYCICGLCVFLFGYLSVSSDIKNPILLLTGCSGFIIALQMGLAASFKDAFSDPEHSFTVLKFQGGRILLRKEALLIDNVLFVLLIVALLSLFSLIKISSISFFVFIFLLAALVYEQYIRLSLFMGREKWDKVKATRHDYVLRFISLFAIVILLERVIGFVIYTAFIFIVMAGLLRKAFFGKVVTP
ncbi:MAG: UbiA family prenyltransferase [Candidatus Methanospirareceae archaeon]